MTQIPGSPGTIRSLNWFSMTNTNNANLPVSGSFTQRNRRRRWMRDARRPVTTRPLPTKGEQWHLLRVPGNAGEPPEVTAEFESPDGGTQRHFVSLSRFDGAADAGHWIGWVQAPQAARQWRLAAVDLDPTVIAAHAVAERDVKCHPMANVPRPDIYRTPFPIERIVLPQSLAGLAPLLDGPDVRVIGRPRSLRELAKAAMGCACVLDPEWVDALKLTLHDIERIVPITWLLIDLPTMARLANAAGVADARVATQRSPHGLMSARVEYAEVPTRGFALMDVFPYGVHDPQRGFSIRSLTANRSWKCYAGECGFALVLSSHTPSETRGPDILSAMRAIGSGELIATDLPWLAAGLLGPPVAPELARHALRMHLGCRLAGEPQYWTRWNDSQVMVRDIADMTRRYPPLEPVRWRPEKPGGLALGVQMACDDPSHRNGPPRRLVLQTGRIDQCDRHDGVPPEPMMIFLRQLARDWQERTDWAVRHLRNTHISWRFDTADGLRYGVLYPAAGAAPPANTVALTIRTSPDARAVGTVQHRGGPATLLVPERVGVFGDRSLDYQVRLTAEIRKWIAESP